MSERPGAPGDEGADSSPEGSSDSRPRPRQPEPLTRLDPDRANRRDETPAVEDLAADPAPARPADPATPAGPAAPAGPARLAGRTEPGPPPGTTLAPPVVDTRRYRWMIGIFGLTVVVVVSVYQFLTNGVSTAGIPPGKPLHYFSAPLANTNLSGIANTNPPCTLARHDPRVLNICLIAHRRPLVLSLFSAASSQCERQVDALQRLSTHYAAGRVQFAAVAVNSSQSATRALIRSHHWTIPVAYDSGNVVGGLYDVAVCPMAELAYRGGIVKFRLIGDAWQTSASLAPKVQALLNSEPPSK